MASHKNFQVERNKKKNNVNLFTKGHNNRKKPQTKSERLMEGIGIWTSYYRANPQRFAKDYLNLELKLFQHILLFIMMHFNFLTYIAARGQGKTFLTAIFCVIRAILYPGTKIIAVGGLKSQGKEIIGKITEIMADAPLLAREISYIKDTGNDPRVTFHNGSWIRVVAANDGARGGRSNLLIVDEYRMVDVDIIDSVLKKFQSTPRQPKYLNKPDYAHLKERNKQIYLSSAWYKAHESWDRVVSYMEQMTDGKSYFTCALPYQISVKEGLLMEEEIADEMSEKTFNEVKWEMEMNAQFWGANLNAYFTYDDLQKNRKLERVYYPKDVSEYVNDKDVVIPKKEPGEIRLISADIATMKGSENDNTAFFVARLLPVKNGYDRQIVYAETMEGGHTSVQATRIRQLYYDFDCDYIVLDTQNAGIGVYDALTEYKTDPVRGTEYPPLSCMNDERLEERCMYPNAPKVVYSIRGNRQLNSEIAAIFRDTLRQGKMKLPIHEGEVADVLLSIKGYSTLEPEAQHMFRMPYIQTTLLVNEVLNLEAEITDQRQIVLKEVGTARKDRYSALSYLNYFASELEIKNRKQKKKKTDPSKWFMMKSASPY